jgi:hypothetical protein
MIDDTEPPGVPADELEAFVLGRLRTALEAGALENALEQAGLGRNEVLGTIDEETIDGDMLGKLISQVLAGAPQRAVPMRLWQEVQALPRRLTTLRPWLVSMASRSPASHDAAARM